MEQLEFFSVPNPCVGVCSADAKGYCQGCMRKREERFRWQSMSPAEQRHVIKLCQQRYRRQRHHSPPQDTTHTARSQDMGLSPDSAAHNVQQSLF